MVARPMKTRIRMKNMLVSWRTIFHVSLTKLGVLGAPGVTVILIKYLITAVIAVATPENINPLTSATMLSPFSIKKKTESAIAFAIVLPRLAWAIANGTKAKITTRNIPGRRIFLLEKRSLISCDVLFLIKFIYYTSSKW